jgi:hypothetical protein
MKTSVKNFNPVQIASQVAEVVLNKGTAFAGFDYHGKRRNVTLGQNLDEFLADNPAKTGWGESFANAAIVAHDGKLYIQGVENNVNGNRVGRALKRFNIEQVGNFVIG